LLATTASEAFLLDFLGFLPVDGRFGISSSSADEMTGNDRQNASGHFGGVNIETLISPVFDTSSKERDP
jgi:hypothetical protein